MGCCSSQERQEEEEFYLRELRQYRELRQKVERGELIISEPRPIGSSVNEGITESWYKLPPPRSGWIRVLTTQRDMSGRPGYVCVLPDLGQVRPGCPPHHPSLDDEEEEEEGEEESTDASSQKGRVWRETHV